MLPARSWRLKQYLFRVRSICARFFKQNSGLKAKSGSSVLWIILVSGLLVADAIRFDIISQISHHRKWPKRQDSKRNLHDKESDKTTWQFQIVTRYIGWLTSISVLLVWHTALCTTSFQNQLNKIDIALRTYYCGHHSIVSLPHTRVFSIQLIRTELSADVFGVTCHWSCQ